MKLITISGLDGSGKSTQLELLKAYLENQGKKVFCFHSGNFSVANKILGKKKDSSGKEISVSKAGWFGIQLRKIALAVDLLRFKLLRNKLRNNGYDYILSDRYFYDTIINIEYLSNLKLGFRKFLKPSFRKPDISIYLQVDPDLIMKRERIPDQGPEYLRTKKELYDRYAEIFEMKIIDGDNEQDKIFEELKQIVCQV